MTTQHNQPAFPVAPTHLHGGDTGMTLRDYFAAKAMQGIIASLQEGEDFSCEWAYEVADSMMKARDK